MAFCTKDPRIHLAGPTDLNPVGWRTLQQQSEEDA